MRRRETNQREGATSVRFRWRRIVAYGGNCSFGSIGDVLEAKGVDTGDGRRDKTSVNTHYEIKVESRVRADNATLKPRGIDGRDRLGR